MNKILISFKIRIITIFYILIFVLLLKCNYAEINSPKAILGSIDLSTWNFSNNGSIKLDGQWEFIQSKLVDPNSSIEGIDPSQKGYLDVPKKWNDSIFKEKRLDGMGYGTYRLKVKLKNDINYAIKYKTIGTAYKLYWNSELLISMGKVGTSNETHQSDWVPGYKEISNILPENEILIQVSNYSVQNGGFWDSLVLGEKEKIILLRETYLSRDTFLSGGLFIIGIYHIFIYYFHRKDISNILFGLVCAIISLRSLLVEEIIIRKLFPQIPWIIIANLEYCTFFVVVPIGTMYFRSCFELDFNKLIYRIFIFIGCFFVSIALITRISIYTIFLRPMQILAVITTIYTIFVVIKALIKKREGALVFFIGGTSFFSLVFNDFLHNLKIINTGYYSTIGWFIFIFSQAYMLSKKSSDAMTRVEELTESLEKKVVQRTDELTRERDRLLKANAEIEKLSESRMRLSIIGEKVSGVLHDLKNPMSIIKTFAELVKEESTKISQREEYMDFIIREIERLNQMTFEILDYAKGSIQIQTEKVIMSKLLAEVHQFLKLEFEHSRVSLEIIIEEESEIYIDKERIRRVILNLSKNALEEMNDQERKYFLQIKLYREDNFTVISFKDNGKGLRSEIKKNLFQPFLSGGKEKGTGLGLFMSKEIIEAHSGELSYISSPNGTTFFIKLP